MSNSPRSRCQDLIKDVGDFWREIPVKDKVVERGRHSDHNAGVTSVKGEEGGSGKRTLTPQSGPQQVSA